MCTFPVTARPKLIDAETVVRSITIPFDDKYRFCSVVTAGSGAGVKFYFVDYPPFLIANRSMAGPRATIRIMPSDSRFSRAPCIEASKILGVPHVFHCHDWQTALIPIMLRTFYAEDPAFREVGHRLYHPQYGLPGIFPPDTLPLLMLPWELFTISKMEFFGQVNFLKGALVLF